MKIAIIGGGPAGLYFALLMKRADPAHEVVVIERNRADDTFGWGVVFSDQTLDHLRAADAESYAAITGSFAHWDDIDVHVRGRVVTSGGHGFSGIARKRLLQILQERAASLGVEIRYQTEASGDADLARRGLAHADLVVGADGAHSAVRQRHAAVFRPDLDVRPARYIWLGTSRLFDAFTFLFAENEAGVFQAHAYRFDEAHSAFIVECDARSWHAAGLDAADTAASVVFCERLFAPWLEGHRLVSSDAHLRSPWRQFVRVTNERWHDGNVVLMGDAAHTAHFSIGSGTKLALEDAIALARILADAGDAPLHERLQRYEDERRTEALRLQNAARNSMEWFENVRRYIHLEPMQFAYSLLTRSQRVSHENLRLRDAAYLGGVERWFAALSPASQARHPLSQNWERGTGGEGPPNSAEETQKSDAVSSRLFTPSPPHPVALEPPPPPMFTPFRLRELTLPNRVVVSPMDMYSATDGTPDDFHLVHLGARALGGAGLVMTEMTCVSPEGRITPGCTGMYLPEHAAAWRRVTGFVHRWSPAQICLQLGHSGRKGSVRLPWEGDDVPLPDGEGWVVIGPSALRHAPGMNLPREMTCADMDRVRDDFVRAARWAVEAEFDMLELHCAHGYLLSSFLTPLANRRADKYGGSLENRLRYPLEVFATVREAWPAERPISVRISATDWVDEGLGPEDSVAVARAFHAAGADIIHVSTGQTSADAQPVYGRMWQTPFSDRIRNEAGVPTIAVGNITEFDQVNAIIAAGRADLCALARPHLSDPQWTLHAAALQGYAAQSWPVQYLSGREQLERRLARERASNAPDVAAGAV